MECCVLGLPDKDYGEIVCAIIVPHEEAKRSAEKELKPVIALKDLQNWAKEKLAPYKVFSYRSVTHLFCFLPTTIIKNCKYFNEVLQTQWSQE